MTLRNSAGPASCQAELSVVAATVGWELQVRAGTAWGQTLRLAGFAAPDRCFVYTAPDPGALLAELLRLHTLEKDLVYRPGACSAGVQQLLHRCAASLSPPSTRRSG